MHRYMSIAAVLLASLAVPEIGAATSYRIDPEHTGVTFRVRHLLTNVEGRFTQFDGTVEFTLDEPEKATIVGTIDVASIDTDVTERDEHLRSKDFFDVAKYPKISFESTSVRDVDAQKKTAKIHGNLTLHGVTKAVVLEAEFVGEATDPWGNKKAGFTAQITISRKDFGLNWNEALETGGVLVGDEVQIRIDAEAFINDDE